jgi:hypothetical protein
MIRGRKRKPGSRHACGKRTHAETEREAMQTVIDARQRHYGVTARQARDERLGTSLGRLAYQDLINSAQYEAGLRFAELYQRHHLTLGMPVPHPRSLAGLMITAGIIGGSSAEPDADVVAKLRDRFNATTDALDDCDRAYRMERGRKPSLLLYRVVCVDEDTALWPACDLGKPARRAERDCPGIQDARLIAKSVTAKKMILPRIFVLTGFSDADTSSEIRGLELRPELTRRALFV